MCNNIVPHHTDVSIKVNYIVSRGLWTFAPLKGMFFHFFVYFYVLKLDGIARMMTRILISDACTCALTPHPPLPPPPPPPHTTAAISQLYRADVFIYSLTLKNNSHFYFILERYKRPTQLTHLHFILLFFTYCLDLQIVFCNPFSAKVPSQVILLLGLISSTYSCG